MSGNHWADEAYAVAPLADLERRDPGPVFDWLGRRFPAGGSKIDWRRVAGRHTHHRAADDESLVALVLNELGARLRPDTAVEHVVDG